MFVGDDGPYWPRVEPRHGPHAGKSGDPRSENTDKALGGKKTGKTSASASKAPSDETSSDKTSCTHSGKRATSECCAPAEDVPESSTGKSKKSKAAPPETKKVPVKEDGEGVLD